MAHSTYGLSNMAPSVWSCCRQQTHELNIWIIIFCDTFFSGASVGAKSASVVEGEKKSTWDWEGRKGGKVRWGGAYFFPFSFKELLTTLAFPMPLFFFWTFLSAFWKLCSTHQHSSIYNSTTLLHPHQLFHKHSFIHSYWSCSTSHHSDFHDQKSLAHHGENLNKKNCSLCVADHLSTFLVSDHVC